MLIFHFISPSDNIKQPTTVKGAIKFDMSEIDCAYYQSGVFNTEKHTDACPDDFMTVGAREMPTCETSCCGGDTPGSW